MRVLPPELRKSVETLNDLTSEQLEAARQVARSSKGEAVSYLNQLVVKCNLGWAAPFIDEVLLGSADASTWHIYDALCVPDLEWDDLVAQPLNASLAILDAIDGERAIRQRPQAKWGYSKFCGGPGVVVRAKPYWWESPEGATALWCADDLEPITNMEVAGRRWIASRVAWKWKFIERALPATPQEVATALELKAPDECYEG